MSATTEAARLTEAHRMAQGRLAVIAARQLLAAWELLDPLRLDRTVHRWLAVTTPIVAANRRISAQLAATYLTTFRALELGFDAEPTVPTLADEIDRRQVATSLVVTGPAVVRRSLTRGDPLTRAVTLAQAASTRAATRHVLNGGRDTVVGTVTLDRQALGWARVTSSRACAFCAMLASRGPVYRTETTADFHAHDGCHCSTEPVYRRDAAWPTGSERYRELWNEATAGSDDPLNAFRRALSA